MSALDDARVTLIRYDENDPTCDEGSLAGALEDLILECGRMKAEWIDPQRIAELARNYTDQDKAGWVSITFVDHDPTFGPQWQIMLPGNRHSDHRTMAEAIKESES